MEDLYTFLHSIPSKNVSNQVKSRCYEDPFCAWKRFKEKCVCYQNPCDTHQCDGHQHGPWCNCSKLLCDWDTTRGYGACQLVQNKQDDFCSCRRDFEYPSYNPNVSFKNKARSIGDVPNFCEVWFLPESVVRVVTIVGDHRCHTLRH
ncbi:UNVERIFIED_CONTAM: hypothetical protein NCL1_13126 [Trichonephila clavipes]